MDGKSNADAIKASAGDMGRVTGIQLYCHALMVISHLETLFIT